MGAHHAVVDDAGPPERPSQPVGRGEALFKMSDEEIAMALSVPTPPVPKKLAANG